MVTVGIRELKNRLSEYLRLVRSGEMVQVTDRGTVVAELRPPGQTGDLARTPKGLLALARSGAATLGATNEPSRYETGRQPLLKGMSSKDLLDADRGER